MTPQQIELARHALGLPNSSRKSYRNHFVTESFGEHGKEWEAMVAAGDATKMDSEKARKRFDGCDCYWLTRQGASAALLKGEKLCGEDFPVAAQQSQDAST